MLRKLFGAARAPVPACHRIPEGRRVYAVGDIHGRLDLLDDLLARIAADRISRVAAHTTLIFLGDLVDRGPDSAGVVDRLSTLGRDAADEIHFIIGNHEEVFLAALAGDAKALRLFCRIGGRETILSYGMSAAEYEGLDYSELASRMNNLVPAAHRSFLDGFETMVTIGDYAFVHAGVRPGVPFDEQAAGDLRWIRSPFLNHRAPLERMVVHGHTIETVPTFLPHRIGIDTGAYETNVLTALGLENDSNWLIQTSA